MCLFTFNLCVMIRCNDFNNKSIIFNQKNYWRNIDLSKISTLIIRYFIFACENKYFGKTNCKIQKRLYYFYNQNKIFHASLRGEKYFLESSVNFSSIYVKLSFIMCICLTRNFLFNIEIMKYLKELNRDMIIIGILKEKMINFGKMMDFIRQFFFIFWIYRSPWNNSQKL